MQKHYCYCHCYYFQYCYCQYYYWRYWWAHNYTADIAYPSSYKADNSNSSYHQNTPHHTGTVHWPTPCCSFIFYWIQYCRSSCQFHLRHLLLIGLGSCCLVLLVLWRSRYGCCSPGKWGCFGLLAHSTRYAGHSWRGELHYGLRSLLLLRICYRAELVSDCTFRWCRCPSR